MTPRSVRIVGGILTTAITAAVLTGYALGGAVVNRLPQTWWFIVPFGIGVLGLLMLFGWIQKRL